MVFYLESNIMSFARKALAAASLVLAGHASAAVISGTTLVNDGSSYSSMAVDPVTGKAYLVKGYIHDGVATFANTGALESHTVSGNLATDNWGTYLAAYNGSLYMRTGGLSSLQLSKISATTGAVQASTLVNGGMGTANGQDTFDWGGYSGVNAMSDGSKLYVVGGRANNNKWSISTFDYALNQQSTVNFDLLNGHAGYAFAINGYVFFGDSYGSTHISRRVDATTGVVQNVDFTLAGLTPAGTYITGITYDSLHDTLYTANAGGMMGKAGNIAAQLGVRRAEVPEPGSVALFGLGLAALGLLRRRKAQA